MNILLVDMPFGLAERPSLALSLLKPVLESRGAACDISYANLAFAELLGLEDYEHIANGLPEHALVGEWVFGESLFGPTAPSLEKVGALLVSCFGEPLEILEPLKRARSLALKFIEDYVESVPWAQYDVVGFTSSCHQNVASLAVAARLKALCPGAVVVFGGPNWDGQMGVSQLERFGFVDYACLGEAEESFPALIERISRSPEECDSALPGVARRQGASVVVDDGEWCVADLDSLPSPDYSDYFAALVARSLSGRVLPTLNVEASRGCWWMTAGPCTFCGQNRTSQHYREKSVARAVSELAEAGERCPTGIIEMTDNVVSGRFIHEVLPRLAGTTVPGRLFFEARPTLTRQEVALIGAWGCRVQFGIESFSDHALELMRKGTRALENIRLLKWCRSFGVEPTWNLLFGIPGETASDLAETIRLLPSLHFLQPPRSCGAITVDRFSTYYDKAEDYRLRRLRPLAGYACAYPLDAEALGGLAYSFEFDADEPDILGAYRFRIRSEVRKWPRGESGGELRLMIAEGGQTVIADSRPNAGKPVHVLDAGDLRVIEMADGICTREDLMSSRQPRRGGAHMSSAEIDERVDRLVDRRLLVAMGDRYLSLALPSLDDVRRFSAAAVDAIAGRAPRRAKIS